MCLATPGTIVRITDHHPLCRSAAVSFGSIERIINVALVPEAKEGDVVLVHAGIAISLMTADDSEALSVLMGLNTSSIAAPKGIVP